MLKEQNIQIDTGRSSSGDFMRLIHIPTGIERIHPGPMAGVDRHKIIETWLVEIEQELADQGLTEHIVPDYRKKTRWQR